VAEKNLLNHKNVITDVSTDEYHEYVLTYKPELEKITAYVAIQID